MSLKFNPDKALIFRIAHRDNLPWILDNGLHAKNAAPSGSNYRTIGNPDLIDKRSRRIVPVRPGGTLSDYVPFYFTPFSIMMLNIITGMGVKKLPKDEIIIFVSSLFRIKDLGIPLVFTNQHAYLQMAEYFTDLADLGRVDWPLLQSRNFRNDPDDLGKKDRYQAEALVWKHVPLEALEGVCCYSTTVASEIRAHLDQRDLTLKTVLEPSWYF